LFIFHFIPLKELFSILCFFPIETSVGLFGGLGVSLNKVAKVGLLLNLAYLFIIIDIKLFFFKKNKQN